MKFVEDLKLERVSVTLDSDQILNLTTNPVVIVPSPGIGYTAHIQWTAWQYRFDGQPYVAMGCRPDLLYHGGINPGFGFVGVVPFVGLIDQNVSKFSTRAGGNVVGWSINNQNVAALDNLSIDLSNSGSAITSGNGTLTVTILYIVMPSLV